MKIIHIIPVILFLLTLYSVYALDFPTKTSLYVTGTDSVRPYLLIHNSNASSLKQWYLGYSMTSGSEHVASIDSINSAFGKLSTQDLIALVGGYTTGSNRASYSSSDRIIGSSDSDYVYIATGKETVLKTYKLFGNGSLTLQHSSTCGVRVNNTATLPYGYVIYEGHDNTLNHGLYTDDCSAYVSMSTGGQVLEENFRAVLMSPNILIVSKVGSNFKILVYDDSFTYLKTEDISTGLSSALYYDAMTDGNWIWFTAHNNTDIITRQYGWDAGTQTLSLVSSTNTNITDVNLKHSISYDQFGNYYIAYPNYYLTSTSTCACGSWEDVDCVGSIMKQYRDCNPVLCDSQIQYVNSTICEIRQNETLGIRVQKYIPFFNSTSCTSNKVGLGYTTSCSVYLDIPLDCTAVNTTVEVTPVVSYIGQGICTKGTMKMTACDPSYSCEQYNGTSAIPVNLTLTKDYNSYFAGQRATGSGSLWFNPASKCQVPILYFIQYGVDTYQETTTLSYTCTRACKEETICLNDHDRATNHIDCSQTNVTYCENGCSSGQCQGIATVSNPLSIKLSTEQKYVIWSILTLVSTIGVGLYTRSSKSNSLLTSIALGLMVFIGVTIGWFPIFIVFVGVIFGFITLLLKR